jgi:phage FluMu protein Com
MAALSLWNDRLNATSIDEAFAPLRGITQWREEGLPGTSLQEAYSQTPERIHQVFRGRDLIYDSRIPNEKPDREKMILTESVILRKLLPEEDSDCCITLEPIAESGKYVQCGKCHKVLDYSAFSSYIFSNPILFLNPKCPHCRQTFPIPAQVFQNQNPETSTEIPLEKESSIFKTAMLHLMSYTYKNKSSSESRNKIMSESSSESRNKIMSESSSEIMNEIMNESSSESRNESMNDS